MIPLAVWAKEHNISTLALVDLCRHVLGTDPTAMTTSTGKSESALQQRIKIKASQQGRRMYRNNCGVAYRNDGVPIRFGLCNDSQKIHDQFRSSDLIGITPVTILPENVGQLFGLFTSWEIKKPGWVYNPNDKHESCQNAWNNLIVSLGGDGRFITSENDI